MDVERRLRLLSLLHYVYGVFISLAGTALLVVVLIGVFMHSDLMADEAGSDMPRWLGAGMQVFGWAVFLLVETVGVLNIISGSLLSRRRGRTFSIAVAILDCFNIPLGLLMGIFTLVTLFDRRTEDAYGLTAAAR
ncbi:MAG: hypothetical protein H6597_06060 [Flavobacteriales bacterium]|nr:hypothetical protein [Flavobacteriales bacterium]MCB9194080.1 hypothetical protein [Flavobacteriales bacterium]